MMPQLIRFFSERIFWLLDLVSKLEPEIRFKDYLDYIKHFLVNSIHPCIQGNAKCETNSLWP